MKRAWYSASRKGGAKAIAELIQKFERPAKRRREDLIGMTFLMSVISAFGICFAVLTGWFASWAFAACALVFGIRMVQLIHRQSGIEAVEVWEDRVVIRARQVHSIAISRIARLAKDDYGGSNQPIPRNNRIQMVLVDGTHMSTGQNEWAGFKGALSKTVPRKVFENAEIAGGNMRLSSPDSALEIPVNRIVGWGRGAGALGVRRPDKVHYILDDEGGAVYLARTEGTDDLVRTLRQLNRAIVRVRYRWDLGQILFLVAMSAIALTVACAGVRDPSLLHPAPITWPPTP